MACISLEGLNIIGIGSGNNSSATDQFAAIIGGRGSGGGRKAKGGDKENEGGGELHGWIGSSCFGVSNRTFYESSRWLFLLVLDPGFVLVGV